MEECNAKDILDFLSEFAVFLQDHKFAVSESALHIC